MFQAGYVFILLSVAFLYIFVCVDEHGEGCMAKLKIFFWKTLPAFMLKAAGRICGQRFVWMIERISHYICYEPNPFVQIIYFVCAFGGFYVYVTKGFIHMPNPRVGEIHFYTGTGLMFACYASYFMACWVDPGRLDKDTDKSKLNHAIKRFKYDKIIFEPRKKCRTCLIDKPARSKHCGMCGHCVEKFDHHCVWINQCVGLHNHKYFLAFLGLHAVLTTYGVWCGWHILMHIVERDRLMDMTFSTPDGQTFEADKYIVF